VIRPLGAVRCPLVTGLRAAPSTRQRLASRARLLVVTVAVLAAGCGGATKFPDDPVAVPTTAIPTSTAPPRAVSAGTATTAAPSTAAAPAATTTTRRSRAATARTTVTRATTTTVDTGDLTIQRAARGSPRDAAGVILQPAPARSLVVEVLAEPGVGANRIALNRVISDLRKYSGKTVTEVQTTLPAGSSSRRWTEAELESVADRSSKVPQGGGRFVLRMMFVRGQNARSPNILAVTFRGDTFAAFPERYASLGQQIVTAVTVHEVGHILGLVDLYLDRNRADTQVDPAGGGHSTNRASVMYYAVDPSILGALFGSASDRYDGQDERDLAAIRAGAAQGSNPR
jgi:hypothetical protein